MVLNVYKKKGFKLKYSLNPFFKYDIENYLLILKAFKPCCKKLA